MLSRNRLEAADQIIADTMSAALSIRMTIGHCHQAGSNAVRSCGMMIATPNATRPRKYRAEVDDALSTSWPQSVHLPNATLEEKIIATLT